MTKRESEEIDATMVKKERRKSLYRKPTQRALEELYAETRQPVTRPAVQKRIEELAKREDCPEEERIEHPVQSTVWRMLESLVDDELAFKVDEGYLPNNLSAHRTILRKRIIAEIDFNRPDVARMSSTTFLLDVASNSVDLAKRLFRDYLGTEMCFDILEFNGYVMLMLKYNVRSDTSREDKKRIAKKRSDMYFKIVDLAEKGYKRTEKERNTIRLK